MGQYLLCQKTAQMPYEIEEMGLHIYSAEELCYYIYHNLPMIDDSFINEALIEFIRKDLDMPVLAEKVSRCFQSSADLDSTLLVLLRNVGYYTEEEITEFQEMMIRLHRKNPLERDKRPGGSFVFLPKISECREGVWSHRQPGKRPSGKSRIFIRKFCSIWRFAVFIYICIRRRLTA